MKQKENIKTILQIDKFPEMKQALMSDIIKENEIKELESLVNKKMNSIVYDTDIDGYPSVQNRKISSNFNKTIMGKSNLVFIIQTDKRKRIGYYIKKSIPNKKGNELFYDPDSFLLTFPNEDNESIRKRIRKIEIEEMEDSENACSSMISTVFGIA